MAVAAPLLVACATTGPVSPASACYAGKAYACGQWGDELLQQGERDAADLAHERACEEGVTSSCLTLGRLRMEKGDLDGAEPPLVKVYEASWEEGAVALAELRETRGGVGDRDIAERLRREAPALDKPSFDFVFAYRADVSNGPGTEITLNIQPMALYERRLTFGANTSFSLSGAVELNGFAGYQHFFSSWLVTYARVMMGAALSAVPGQGPNVGAELGAKLCLGSIGHLNLAAGSTRASPGYVSVGLGLDGLLVLIAAAHIR
ncbi:hypothetical protein [Pyxidicoccus fallax]|nr:hypothetical protein [Pyxidicoccus fallax]